MIIENIRAFLQYLKLSIKTLIMANKSPDDKYNDLLRKMDFHIKVITISILIFGSIIAIFSFSSFLNVGSTIKDIHKQFADLSIHLQNNFI